MATDCFAYVAWPVLDIYLSQEAADYLLICSPSYVTTFSLYVISLYLYAARVMQLSCMLVFAGTSQGGHCFLRAALA